MKKRRSSGDGVPSIERPRPPAPADPWGRRPSGSPLPARGNGHGIADESPRHLV